MASKTQMLAANCCATAGTSSRRPKSHLGTHKRLPAIQHCNTSSRYVKLLKQLIGGFQLMMIAGAVLCFIAGPLDSPPDFQVDSFIFTPICLSIFTRCTRPSTSASSSSSSCSAQVCLPSIRRRRWTQSWQASRHSRHRAQTSFATARYATVFQFTFRNCIPVHFGPQVIEIDAGELVVGDVVKGTLALSRPTSPCPSLQDLIVTRL